MFTLVMDPVWNTECGSGPNFGDGALNFLLIIDSFSNLNRCFTVEKTFFKQMLNSDEHRKERYTF